MQSLEKQAAVLIPKLLKQNGEILKLLKTIDKKLSGKK